MIAVTLNSNGRYWQMSWTAGGVRHRESLGLQRRKGMTEGLTRSEAREMCRRKEQEFIKAPGMAALDEHATLEAWRAEYPIVKAKLKPGTLRLADQVFVSLIAQFGAGRELRAITRSQASLWAGKLRGKAWRGREGRRIGPATVARYIRSARAVFQAAEKIELIPFNPFSSVDAGASVVSDWRYVPLDELATLMDAAPDAERRLILAFARLAGLRRGEIIRLDWSDLNHCEMTIRILPELVDGARVEGTKQRIREVPISPQLAEEIQRFGSWDGRGPIFSISPRALNSWLNRLGVDYGKPLHTLRKSLVTDWVNDSGADLVAISLWTDHSLDVLKKHYYKALATTLDKVRRLPATISPQSSPNKGHSADNNGEV